jgi:multicomponent Na+:H+ antiporter subunit F
MHEWHWLLASFLLLNLIAGLIRLMRGPTAADRMIAAQLFGTTGVAVLLIMTAATGSGALLDVALIYALLAALFTIAFVRLHRF